MSEILEIQKTELKIIVRDPQTNNIKTTYNIDLNENVSVEITKSIIDIQNLDQRLADYSKDIIIPGTDNNNKIFSNFFNTKHYVMNDTLTNGFRYNFNGDFNPTMITECQLYIDNVNVMNGTLELKDTFSTEEYSTNYRILITGEIATLFKKISGLYLSDLKDQFDTTQDHKYSYSAVSSNSLTFFDNKDYVYALIDRGQPTNQPSNNPNSSTDGNYNWFWLRSPDFTYCWKIKSLWDAIFKKNGFTYKSKFLNDDMFIKNINYSGLTETKNFPFSQLVMPNNNSMNSTNTEELALRSFQSYMVSGTTRNPSTSFTVGTQNVVRFDNFVHSSIGQYSGGTYPSVGYNSNGVTPAANDGGFKVLEPSVMSFNTKLDFNIAFNFTGSITYNFSYDLKFEVYVHKKSNPSLYILLGEYNIREDGSGLTTAFNKNYKIEFGTKPYQVDRDDVIYVQYKFYTFSFNFTGIGSATSAISFNNSTNNPLTATNMFYGNATSKIVEDGWVSLKGMLPNDIKQDEFLMNIIKSFNLYIQPGINPNEFIIEPRDQFLYNNDLQNVNLNDKVDKTQIINVKPIGGLVDKNFIYNFKSDSDKFNKLYSDTTKKIYGERKISIVNDILKSEKKIETLNSPCVISDVGNQNLILPYSKKNIGIVDIDRIDGNINNKGSISTLINTDLDSAKSNMRILNFSMIRQKDQNNNLVPLFSMVKVVYQYNPGPNNFTWGYYKNPNDTDGERFIYPYAGSLIFDKYVDITKNIEVKPQIDLDLNFGRPDILYGSTLEYWNDGNLFNIFHKNGIAELSDKNSKIVEFYIALTLDELKQLNFQSTYIIDYQYYKLYDVTYNNLKNQSSKVRFLKMSKLNIFSSSTISIGGIQTISNGSTGGNGDNPNGLLIKDNVYTDIVSDYGSVLTTAKNNASIGSQSIIGNGNGNLIQSSNVAIISSNNNNIYKNGVTMIGTNSYVNDWEGETAINNIQFPFTKEIIVSASTISSLRTVPYQIFETPIGYYVEINEVYVKYYYNTADFNDRSITLHTMTGNTHLYTVSNIFGRGINTINKGVLDTTLITNENISIKGNGEMDGVGALGYIKIIFTYRLHKF